MLRWIDGFESYYTLGYPPPFPQYQGIDHLLARRYTGGVNAGFISSRAGRWAGYCIRMQGDNNYIQTPILTTNPTIIVGVAFKRGYAVSSKLIMLYDGATLGISVGIEPSGELTIYQGATGVVSTSGLGIALGRWYYLELKVTCSDTGSYEVRLDGGVVMSDNDFDTKMGANSYHDRVRLGAYSYTDYTYFDDFYICDTTGSLNNDYLGPARVVVASPDGEFATNWSTVYPANGSHYTSIDDGTVADDDTTYVEDDTSGHLDMFEYSSLSTLGTIYGVSVLTDCLITDVDPMDLKTITESDGSTETVGTTTLTNVTYYTIDHISETDPSTANYWLEADLNNAHFGFEVG